MTLFRLLLLICCSCSLISAANFRLGVCEMEELSSSGISGTIWMNDDQTAGTEFYGEFLFPDTLSHGIHLFEYGGISDRFTMGGHFNPSLNAHGIPGVSPENHDGDLGNVLSTSNNSTVTWSFGPVQSIRLIDNESVIGRAMAVSTIEDTDSELASDPFGGTWLLNGARCVIGVADIANIPSRVQTALGITIVPANDDNIAVASSRASAGLCSFPIGGGVEGDVTVRSLYDGSTRFEYDLTGPDGTYAFQLREFGYTSAADIGDTYDPDGDGHGTFPSLPRADGTLGDVIFTGGSSIGGDNSTTTDFRGVVGRALIVGTNPDNGSNPNGGAGTPRAICVVGLRSTLPPGDPPFLDVAPDSLNGNDSSWISPSNYLIFVSLLIVLLQL